MKKDIILISDDEKVMTLMKYLIKYSSFFKYSISSILGISIGFSSGYSAGRPGLLAGYLA